MHADPCATNDARIVAERAFEILNQYCGIAIGEHLGQLLTAAFVATLALLQAGEGSRITAPIGFVTALDIAIGTSEGLAIALGRSGESSASSPLRGSPD